METLTIGVLPAYAGMIRQGPDPVGFVGGAPRVCGDDPQDIVKHLLKGLCSPRMRG